MSWLFSRALVEEYLEESSSDGVPCALLSETNTHQAYLYSDKTTDTWSLSRFGMTFAHLTESRGAAALTSFLEAFPVRTLAPQEKGQESKESDLDSGWRWQESSVKYDPDSCSWKTRQFSLLGGLEEFSETWPRWGTMQSGESWERTMPEHLTSGTGSGSLLPTPTASQYGFNKSQGQNAKHRPSLAMMARHNMWPTPTVNDSKNNGSQSQRERKSPNLNAVIGGKLNPNWVEWLMGWPVGWTDSRPLEMDKFQQWQRLHFKS